MAVMPTILAAAEATTTEKVNNPILPTANEFFWAAVTFLLLWLLMKYVLLPPLMKVMEERTKKRVEDLDAAYRAENQMEEAQERYDAALSGARAEAVAKIEAARREAEEYRQGQMAGAEADAAAARAAGAAEAADARAAAMAELRGSLADLAVGAAEAVVERPIDRQSQLQVIEDYINRTEPGA